jgi:hypothetical protein
MFLNFFFFFSNFSQHWKISHFSHRFWWTLSEFHIILSNLSTSLNIMLKSVKKSFNIRKFCRNLGRQAGLAGGPPSPQSQADPAINYLMSCLWRWTRASSWRRLHVPRLDACYMTPVTARSTTLSSPQTRKSAIYRKLFGTPVPQPVKISDLSEILCICI